MVGGGAVCVGCGRLVGMHGGSVVGQTVQPVQAWKMDVLNCMIELPIYSRYSKDGASPSPCGPV